MELYDLKWDGIDLSRFRAAGANFGGPIGTHGCEVAGRRGGGAAGAAGLQGCGACYPSSLASSSRSRLLSRLALVRDDAKIQAVQRASTKLNVNIYSTAGKLLTQIPVRRSPTVPPPPPSPPRPLSLPAPFPSPPPSPPRPLPLPAPFPSPPHAPHAPRSTLILRERGAFSGTRARSSGWAGPRPSSSWW